MERYFNSKDWLIDRQKLAGYPKDKKVRIIMNHFVKFIYWLHMFDTIKIIYKRQVMIYFFQSLYFLFKLSYLLFEEVHHLMFHKMVWYLFYFLNSKHKMVYNHQ